MIIKVVGIPKIIYSENSTTINKFMSDTRRRLKYGMPKQSYTN